MIHADDNPHLLSVITNLKDRLTDIIEPDFGLLGELLRLEVLSRRQYDKVRSGDKAAYERSGAVLDQLTSENQCVNFLKALQLTGQQHVVNFITQNGGQKPNLEITCFRKFLRFEATSNSCGHLIEYSSGCQPFSCCILPADVLLIHCRWWTPRA